MSRSPASHAFAVNSGAPNLEAVSLGAVFAPAPDRDALYAPLARFISRSDWERLFADDIEAIWRLKKERNAVILAHNYQSRRARRQFGACTRSADRESRNRRYGGRSFHGRDGQASQSAKDRPHS